MPISNIEATGAAIAAPGTRPVYTADVVIKDATEAYIECPVSYTHLTLPTKRIV